MALKNVRKLSVGEIVGVLYIGGEVTFSTIEMSHTKVESSTCTRREEILYDARDFRNLGVSSTLSIKLSGNKDVDRGHKFNGQFHVDSGFKMRSGVYALGADGILKAQIDAVKPAPDVTHISPLDHWPPLSADYNVTARVVGAELQGITFVALSGVAPPSSPPN